MPVGRMPVGRRPWRYVLSHEPIAVHRRRGGRRTVESVLVSFLARGVLVFARARWRWRVTGELPATAVVLVSTHTSYWDGLIASMLDPRVHPVTGRDWRSPAPLGWFLDAYGVLWTDDDPISSAEKVLAGGGIVWIAPAGWERYAQGAVRRGAAEIARAAGVPIYALHLTGLTSRRLELTLTEVLSHDPDRTSEQTTAALLAALRPEPG